jgi:NAD(P)H dehydrogenase (quinone)
MPLIVTGANGHLGRLVVQDLLTRRPAHEIAVSVRDPRQAADLAERGVDVRRGDFDDPASLPAAFAGADRILIISTLGDEAERTRQHAAAVSAAARCGARRIVYTSVTRADTSQHSLARPHLATERAIAATGVPATILRNNWYFENDLGTVAAALGSGTIVTSTAGRGYTGAARADFAAAAAAVLAGEDGVAEDASVVYELGGQRSVTYDDWAEAITAASGTQVRHVEADDATVSAGLAAAGLPPVAVDLVTGFYAAVRRGEYDLPDDTLARLIGRPPVTLDEWVAGAVAQVRAG